MDHNSQLLQHKKEKLLTQSKLKEILNYDKHTGIFTRTINGEEKSIGHKDSKEYFQISIRIDDKRMKYPMHRLAWLYEYGAWPKNQLDHINHDRSDNRILNLREVNNHMNHKNKTIYSSNKSGIPGVSFINASKKWRATIKMHGKQIHLGCYKDKNKAICARLHANKLYKFHVNHGK